MITFRVGAYDAEVLEKEFAPTFTAEDLVNLGSYQIYLKLMIDGISSQPFSASTLPPIKKPETSSVDEVIKNSRLAYAKPRSVVEKIIADWHEEGKREPVKAPPKEKRHTDARQHDRREPKPMDFRGQRETRPPFPAERPKQPEPPAKAIRTETIPKVEENGFKPLSALSLSELQQKKNNQRDPSPKNVYALRSALSAIVKDTKPQTHAPRIPEKPAEPKIDQKKEEPKKVVKEVPEDTLKSLLGAE
jgi:hypothetical protein